MTTPDKMAEVLARLKSRFESFVDKDGPIPSHMPHLGKCWKWTGATRGEKGKRRGLIYFKGKMIAAAKASLIIQGKYQEPLWTLHHCDNPNCVNPEHLFCGDCSDNQKDAYRKGRRKSYVIRIGTKNHKAKLTPEKVQEMRGLFGKISNAEIGRRYGIATASVWLIRKGKNWGHLAALDKLTNTKA